MRSSSSELKRELVRVPDEWPLIGHIAFGLIDRGTNLIQVRPVTTCPLCCVFCSVDVGPCSRRRQVEYVVELDHIVEWFAEVAKFKGSRDIQAHIDTVGDPLTYPELVELVQALSEVEGVSVISLETHGPLLTERVVDELEAAGLTRINLSIDSLDPNLAKELAGVSWFDVTRVAELAEYIARCTSLDLIITPVWVPGLNDREIPRIIEFATRIGAGKRCPPLGIQKYEAHKHGRKPRGVKPMSWGAFYAKLREWERAYGVKLVLRPEDFGIRRAKELPLAMRRGEVVRAKVVGPGWLRGQALAVARGRVVTVVGVRDHEPLVGQWVKVRVLRVKHNIYVARMA